MQSSACAFRVAAAGAIAFFFAREARSFCRTVTHLPPAGWNVVAQGCFVDSAAGAKALFWGNSCVGYSIHQRASRLVTFEQATTIVADAFDAWSSSACAQGGRPSVGAVDLGPVECGKAQYNRGQANQNVIVFHDDEWPHGASDKTLGLTTLTFDTMTGEIVGADMEINATQNLVVGDDVPAGSYSLASIVTHEAGHFLGLAHSAETSAIMFAQYKATIRLASDDVLGVCAIYAPNGSRVTTDGPVAGASCDPTPRGGFISACTPPPATSDPDTAESGGGCSLGARAARRSGLAAPMAALGLALLALVDVRRRHARTRTARTRRGVRLLRCVVLVTSLLFAKVARASMFAIALEELTQASSAAAIVRPVEQRSVWESGRICTYTRVSVDQLVAGDLPGEIWVRTLGGVVGPTGQVVEGEAVLAIGQAALLFLRPQIDRATGAAVGTFEVTARAQGQFLITVDENKRRLLVSSPSVGALVAPSARVVADPERSSARHRGPLAAEALHGRSVEDAARRIAALFRIVRHW